MLPATEQATESQQGRLNENYLALSTYIVLVLLATWHLHTKYLRKK